MRADRLLSILLLLQVHRRLTARELAQRLEVCERTIHRDMEALSGAGIPVVAERGIGGGWMLLEEYQTKLTGLTEAEIQALFLTRPAHLLADLGLHQAGEAALIKLLAAIPSISRRDAEYVRQRIHVDTAGWHPSEENIAALPMLQEAIWQERKVHLIYQRGSDTTVERVVDPLGLVAKGSVWYLVAAVDDDIRVYRVSRIQDARVADQPCTRPPGFDLAAYWSQSSALFVAALPRYPVTVRIAPEALRQIRRAGRYARIEQAEEPDADGWIKLHLLFEMEETACGYLLSLGTRVEILEPQDLREKILQLARNVLASYGERQPCHSADYVILSEGEGSARARPADPSLRSG
jgi:predicted DNA-binding transcriptional regulator YafY